MQGRLGWLLPKLQVPRALWLAAGVSLLAGCVSGLHLERAVYPATARVGVVDNYHGTRVADPYRWLEGLDSSATAQWVTAQNRVSLPYLKALPQRAWLQERLTQLYRYERYGVPRRVADRYFFVHNDGQQNQAALYVANSPSETGRRLIDPETIRGDATVSLGDYEPSPDGRLLAYS
jgi:prolyl oligopeptidase